MQIIHGEDQKKSRATFIDLKKKFASTYQIVDISGTDCALSDIVGAAETNSLFGQQTFVVLESIFSRRPSNEKKNILSWLENNPKSNVLIWEGKDVSVQLKKFPPQQILKFDLPKYVFYFLDSLSVKDLEQALEVTEPEIIVSLLAKRISDIMLYSSGNSELPSWQLSKIKFLAEKFSADKILEFNNELLKLDYRQKNSQSALPLAQGLELLMIKFNN